MPTLPTPNMNLNLPVVGNELGPQYGSDNNAAFFQVDSHNHSSGQGVLVPTSGIDINTDLPFNGNNAISLNSVIFNNLSAPLAGSSPYLNAIYVSGGNLFYNDAVGNQIQITSDGTVNATSSGIVSGTATASFVGGVLVVNQAPFTPANIQAGSILIGNNVANSFFAQLQAPNALSATYPITLPPVNNTSNTVFLTYDASDNMGLGPNVTGGIDFPNLSAGVNAALNNASPSGTIVMFGGTTAPTAWLICDGSAVSRTTYANLFTAISTNFGIGDGTTTFNIPDFRGIFPRGVDNGAGNDPDAAGRTAVNGGNSGNNVGSNQTSEFAVHAHSFVGDFGDVSASSPPYGATAQFSNGFFAPVTIGLGGVGNAGGSSETRPINLYVNFIIKT